MAFSNGGMLDDSLLGHGGALLNRPGMTFFLRGVALSDVLALGLLDGLALNDIVFDSMRMVRGFAV